MGNFKKGLFLGSVLGATLAWLNITPKGKEMRSKILSYADELFGELKDSLRQLEGPTKEMYDALVERSVEEFGNKKELAKDVKMLLAKRLKKKWNQLQRDIREK